MKIIKLSLFIFLLGFFHHLKGQVVVPVKTFGSDNKSFSIAVKKFMDDSKNPKCISIAADFTKIWDENGFTPTVMSEVLLTSNKLLEGKIRASGEFEGYLTSIIAFKTGTIDESKIQLFHKTMLEVFSKDRKNFKDFLEACENVFARQNINETTVKSWKVSSKDMTFKFLKEGIIEFSKTDLSHITKGDTITIFQTKGVYLTNSKKWNGEGGDVYWVKLGLDKKTVKATLTKYRLDTRNSEYTADSVQFIYPKVLQDVVIGRLQDKAFTTKPSMTSDYPRFTSYKSVFRLNNVFRNIDFQGGFTLEGNQIKGTGTDKSPAKVTIYRNGKPQIRALSKSFSIDKDKLTAGRAAVSIYLDKDSIYHSSCGFNYQDPVRKLTLSRKDEGVFAAPFSNSYHQVDYMVDNMFWNIDENKITLKTISNATKDVNFESQYFYSENRMVQMQGILNYNPIVKLGRYFLRQNNASSTLNEIASELGNEPRFVEEQLFTLARDGFVFYNVESQVLTPKNKLSHYDGAYSKGEDYDVIKFTSNIPVKPNATLDLENFDMQMEGVEIIKLSDSQKTYIIPKDKKFILKKNRDMIFEGQVHAGRFDFYGKGFNFDYDSFLIGMKNVDSMKFKFPEYDKKTGKLISIRDIQTVIQNITGKLEIDRPNNKSGKDTISKYPIFTCSNYSFAYYDKPSIYGGVYKKDKFFFKIDPFIIKNLDNFTADGLKFPGVLTSSSIFPDIREALYIQEDDYSLGFVNQAPKPKGYPVYQGKGTVRDGDVKLSNRGLKGRMIVDYLVSNTHTKSITFFPDSMNCIADTFEIPEATAGKYPPVFGQGPYNHWMPYKDSMYIYKRKNPISVYKGKINFEGFFILTPSELIGNGTTKYQQLVLKSEKTSFFANKVETKKSDINITTTLSVKNALEAGDVSAELDLTSDFAKFKSNKDTAKLVLASNAYSTTLNQFQYDMKAQEVKFQKSNNQKIEDAYFRADKKEAENLNFTSTNATYNLKDLNLKAENVPFLLIGDAEITTPNKELTIKKDGELGSIRGAIIRCSDKNKFHTITNALVNIYSKNKFTGFGDYDYVDKNNNKYRIFFNDIKTNEFNETIALGNISDTAKFFLAPEIDYQGTVKLYSTVKDLYFNGYLKPTHPYEKQLGTSWVKMADTVDPKNVLFDLQNPKGKDGKELYTGVFYSPDSNNTYSLFYGKKKNMRDVAIQSVNGYMTYDEKQDAFVVNEKQKMFKEDKDDDTAFIGGNSVELNKKMNAIQYFGKFDFHLDKIKVFNYQAAGAYSYNFGSNKGEYNLSMITDFPNTEAETKIVIDSVLMGSSSEKEAKVDGYAVTNAFNLMIKDESDRQKVVNEINGSNYIQSADLINKVFVFSKVKMEWVDTLQAFCSIGTLGLSSIKKIAINKMIGGAIKIKPGKRVDRFAILAESSPNGGYHFFEFANGEASYLSSDQSFNDVAKEIEGKVSKAGFKFKLALVDDASRIKNREKDPEDIQKFLEDAKKKEQLKEEAELKAFDEDTKPKEKSNFNFREIPYENDPDLSVEENEKAKIKYDKEQAKEKAIFDKEAAKVKAKAEKEAAKAKEKEEKEAAKKANESEKSETPKEEKKEGTDNQVPKIEESKRKDSVSSTLQKSEKEIAREKEKADKELAKKLKEEAKIKEKADKEAAKDVIKAKEKLEKELGNSTNEEPKKQENISPSGENIKSEKEVAKEKEKADKEAAKKLEEEAKSKVKADKELAKKLEEETKAKEKADKEAIKAKEKADKEASKLQEKANKEAKKAQEEADKKKAEEESKKEKETKKEGE